MNKEVDIDRTTNLMIPGPVGVNSDVLAEMGSPVVAHYGKEWTKVYNQTVSLMQKVFHTSGDVFLIPGSGSAGLDAALGSCLGSDHEVLIPNNGWFGDRLANIASSYADSSRVHQIRFERGNPVSPNKVNTYLSNHREIDLVAMTHCETSTGVINPVKRIGEICATNDVLLVVDAVTSLGCSAFNMDSWNIGVTVTASQKCLGAPPGLASVAVNQQGWDLIDEEEISGWYLNLGTWKRFATEWSDWHPFPVTMAVNNVLALRESLHQMFEEGLESRYDRHHKVAQFVRTSAENLGFDLFPAAEDSSNSVTAVSVGDRIEVSRLKKFLLEEYNTRIAGSLGDLEGEIFRIGHMGQGARMESVLPLMYAIEDGLIQAGPELSRGTFLRGTGIDEECG